MITLDQLKTRHKQTCNTARDIAIQRGDEYAKKYDTFITFRNASALRNKKPKDLILDLMSIKLSRIQNEVNNEKIPQDSILDLINYTIYLNILMIDEALENRK